MSYEFKRLGEVEALSEVPENATVLAEVNGSIKRIPSNGLGGNGGIKTAIIMSSDYYNTLSGVASVLAAAPEVEYSCTNMSFEEAYQSMMTGEPLSVFGMIALDGSVPINTYGSVSFLGTSFYEASSEPAIGIVFNIDENTIMLTWTASGLMLY